MTIGNKQTIQQQQHQRQPQFELHHPQQYQSDNKNTIDSSFRKTKIIGIYTNGDIMYGDGISTTFYHRESLWAHRRGQGEALRDFQYCQYSSIKEEKSD